MLFAGLLRFARHQPRQNIVGALRRGRSPRVRCKDRATFATLLAAGAAGIPLSAFARRLEGATTTQQALFAALPRIGAGEWTRIILGSGAAYQKQIGAGTEHDRNGNRLLFIETQIGSPGGSRNPSSIRKAYLREPRFGSLLDTYPLVTNIGRIENMIYRFGDVRDAKPTADDTLRLLDEAYLYDARPYGQLPIGIGS